MPPSFCACAYRAEGNGCFIRWFWTIDFDDPLWITTSTQGNIKRQGTRAHDLYFCSARSPRRMIDPLPKSFSWSIFRASLSAFSRSSPNFLEISSNFFLFFAILFLYFYYHRNACNSRRFPVFERHISYPFLELFFIWHKLHYTKFSPFNTAKRTKLKAWRNCNFADIRPATSGDIDLDTIHSIWSRKSDKDGPRWVPF